MQPNLVNDALLIGPKISAWVGAALGGVLTLYWLSQSGGDPVLHLLMFAGFLLSFALGGATLGIVLFPALQWLAGILKIPAEKWPAVYAMACTLVFTGAAVWFELWVHGTFERVRTYAGAESVIILMAAVIGGIVSGVWFGHEMQREAAK